MEGEGSIGIAPAHDLPEAQVVEHQAVGPLFHGVVPLREAEQQREIGVVQERAQQCIVAREVAQLQRIARVEDRTVTDVVALIVLGHHVPEPVVQCGGRDEGARVPHFLLAQQGMHLTFDHHLVRSTVEQVGAAPNHTADGKGGTGALALQQQQHQGGDPRPDGKEGIGHEDQVQRDAHLAEGLEPPGAVRVEAVEQNMPEHFHSEEPEEMWEGDIARTVPSGCCHGEQWRDERTEQDGVCEAAMHQQSLGGAGPQVGDRIHIGCALRQCAP